MSKFLASIVCVLVLALSVSGFIQQITIYQGENQTGESVTFQTEKPNVTPWRFFLQTAKSYCATGWYVFFKFENYIVAGDGPWLFGGGAEEVCGNDVMFQTAYSTRFIGSSETSTRGLYLYQDVGFGGRDVFIVTNLPGAGIPFLTKSLVIMGGAEYTLFEGTNFNGTSFCMRAPNGEEVFIPPLEAPMSIGSVMPGCF